jgi:hypothetical protein
VRAALWRCTHEIQTRYTIHVHAHVTMNVNDPAPVMEGMGALLTDDCAVVSRAVRCVAVAFLVAPLG